MAPVQTTIEADVSFSEDRSQSYLDRRRRCTRTRAALDYFSSKGKGELGLAPVEATRFSHSLEFPRVFVFFFAAQSSVGELAQFVCPP